MTTLLTKCEFCGEVVPQSCGRCPKCGGNVKPGLPHRLWLFLALIVVVMAVWVVIERMR